ncbi:VOC family protein [Catalinimonas sp. 4WD22]|uniref:VOC family protein n=1 Tax=Catalinimonas locisalis TaxID=3133978 RepID=UPI0031010ED0
MNLNQVTIPSLDLGKSVPFYQKLDLNLIVEALPHYARFTCPEGDTTFSIHQVESIAEGEGIYVYFELENLDEHVRLLVAEGILVNEMPTDKRWLWREARLKDPDGNQVVLYWAGDNRLNPPWRI